MSVERNPHSSHSKQVKLTRAESAEECKQWPRNLKLILSNGPETRREQNFLTKKMIGH